MPLFQKTISIAAGAVEENALAGSQWEFAPYPCTLEFGINGDANGGLVRCDVYSGVDVLAENMPLNTANRIPVYPDDFLLNDVADAQERIKIRLRNTHTAAVTVYVSMMVSPL